MSCRGAKIPPRREILSELRPTKFKVATNKIQNYEVFNRNSLNDQPSRLNRVRYLLQCLGLRHLSESRICGSKVAKIFELMKLSVSLKNGRFINFEKSVRS